MIAEKSKVFVDIKNDNEEYYDTLFKSDTKRAILPQIFAALVVSSFSLIVGMGITFSSLLISALEETQSDINIVEKSWIASSYSLATALGSCFVGIFQTHFGRINTIKLSAVVTTIGWTLIACANGTKMIILGRTLSGLVAMGNALPAGIYICETCFPNFKSTALVLPCLFSSMGAALVFIEGFVMSWRLIAWNCAIFSVLLIVLSFFIPESPAWLLSKNKMTKAKMALAWFDKYQNSKQNFSEIHFTYLKKTYKMENESPRLRQIENFKTFVKQPKIFKPLLISCGLCFFQQFSGIYVIMAFAIIFIQNTGSNMDPLLASSLVTGIRVLAALANVITTNYFKRKTLMIISCVGLSVCLLISAIFTKWIQDGMNNFSWVPVICLLTYMALATMGLESIPWITVSEIIHPEIRDHAIGCIMSLSFFIMFLAIQSFQPLNVFFGGSAGIQTFYGIVTLTGTVFVWYFVPETKGKKQDEIEAMFT